MTPADLAELQFFPALFGSILSDGVGDPQDPDAVECGRLLAASHRAPAVSAPPKLKSRSAGLLRAALSAFRTPLVAEKAMVATTALIADRMLGELTGSGYLILHPGSDFDLAMALIRSGLEDVVDDAMRARADDEWDLALGRVQGARLFLGVTVVEAGRRAMARAA